MKRCHVHTNRTGKSVPMYIIRLLDGAGHASHAPAVRCSVALLKLVISYVELTHSLSICLGH
jgi:hypothetical protein